LITIQWTGPKNIAGKNGQVDPPVGRLPVANRNVGSPTCPTCPVTIFFHFTITFFCCRNFIEWKGRRIRSISPLDGAMNDFELGFYSSRFEQVDCHLFQLKSADFPEIIV
jgi:hypothetical protein